MSRVSVFRSGLLVIVGAGFALMSLTTYGNFTSTGNSTDLSPLRGSIHELDDMHGGSGRPTTPSAWA